MTYTCAVYPTADATLEEAQYEKYDLVVPQARPQARACGCSTSGAAGAAWSGTRPALRRQGARRHAVVRSRPSGPARRSSGRASTHLAEVRFLDYRDVAERDFDAVSSIGLTEHIGVRNYPSYFGFLLDRLRPAAGCSTTASPARDNRFRTTGAFIDRYIFPDGELTGSGRIIAEAQDAGFEVRHEENLREHYALPCRTGATT